jgi:hypothetical protein
MNLNQGAVSQGLVDEMLELIYKYDETLYMSTVIGCLELVKQTLIFECIEGDEDA